MSCVGRSTESIRCIAHIARGHLFPQRRSPAPHLPAPLRKASAVSVNRAPRAQPLSRGGTLSVRHVPNPIPCTSWVSPHMIAPHTDTREVHRASYNSKSTCNAVLGFAVARSPGSTKLRSTLPADQIAYVHEHSPSPAPGARSLLSISPPLSSRGSYPYLFNPVYTLAWPPLSLIAHCAKVWALAPPGSMTGLLASSQQRPFHTGQPGVSLPGRITAYISRPCSAYPECGTSHRDAPHRSSS